MDNGDLASIPNQETNEFIVSLFQNHSGRKYKWIGGYDSDEEGVWKWSDGTAWLYQNWDTDQPSNSSGKDYLIMDVKSGKWMDRKINAQQHFICQYKPGKEGEASNPYFVFIHNL